MLSKAVVAFRCAWNLTVKSELAQIDHFEGFIMCNREYFGTGLVCNPPEIQIRPC